LLAAAGSDSIGYRTVFLVSTGLRILALGFGFRVTDRPLLTARMLIRTIAIRPALGGIGRPLHLRGPRSDRSDPGDKQNRGSRS